MSKFYIRFMIIIFVGLSLLVLFNIYKNREVSESYIDIEIGAVGDDFPVKRALVAKMIALSTDTKANILSLENSISFNDVALDDWYYKYINYVYAKGFMSGVNEDEFNPDDVLTLAQAQFLIEQYSKSSSVKIKITDENKDKPITYSLWLEIYKKVADTNNIEEDEITILATSSSSKELSIYTCATDKGLFYFEGLDFEYYVNKKIKVLRQGTEILGIVEVLETTPVLSACYISKISGNSLTIFISGVQKVFKFDADISSVISLDIVGSLADVVIEDENVLGIYVYNEYVRGNVNLVLDDTIRINNINYTKDENIKVYSVLEDGVKFKGLENLIIGQDVAKYFVKDGENKIYGIIIDENPNIDKVRVAISNDNFTERFFESLKIQSESGLKVFVKGQEKEYPSDYILYIENGKDFSIGEKEIIKIQAIDFESGVNLLGLKRGYESPNFKGSIEICKIDGKYLIVNEVYIDDYIKSVISSNSEIPLNEEVIKAFSIILRTNTINKVNENLFYEYSANFDDSSSFQLYNYLPLNTEILEFVDETKNLVVHSGGEVVNLNYFGYSAGVTGNSNEVWADKKTMEFSEESIDYLKSVYLFENGVFENLDDEINANIFFKTKDVDTFENDSNWFRWSTSLELDKINESLYENLKELYENYPYFVKLLENESDTLKNLSSDLNITDLNVVKRGKGGNVMEIELFTQFGKIILMTDTVIKKFFDIDYIINNIGGKVENLANLPSSYFVFDKVYREDGSLEKINFYGGGYGHGVGLSVYGAKKLAENGAMYDEILKTFYSEIEIEEIL